MMEKTSKSAERREQLQEWINNGAEWCANQLWNKTQNLASKKREIAILHDRLAELEGKAASFERLKTTNERLKDVLEENGIRTTKIRIYYKEHRCDVCTEEECYEWECDDYSDAIASIAWYTYHIADDVIDGITSDFKSQEYECYKIVDERTGEVLYEEDEEEGKDEQKD